MNTSITVELAPEIQSIVEHAIEQGSFATPAEVVSAALRIWQDMQEWPAEDMQRMCDEALLDKCPGIPPDQAYSAMMAFCRTLDTSQRNDAA